MALDLVDPLKDAARLVRDIRRAVFREAAEKAGRRRSHNDEAKERDAPHGPPQMLPGAAHWIGSPEQLPAGGGLPVDRTCLPWDFLRGCNCKSSAISQHKYSIKLGFFRTHAVLSRHAVH